MRGLPVPPLALLRNSANSAALDPRPRLYPRVPYVFLSCPVGVVKFSHDQSSKVVTILSFPIIASFPLLTSKHFPSSASLK